MVPIETVVICCSAACYSKSFTIDPGRGFETLECRPIETPPWRSPDLHISDPTYFLRSLDQRQDKVLQDPEPLPCGPESNSHLSSTHEPGPMTTAPMMCS